jgi:hypothetical protein
MVLIIKEDAGLIILCQSDAAHKARFMSEEFFHLDGMRVEV